MVFRSNKYDIIVLSDLNPEQRQFSLTKKKLVLSGLGILMLVLGLVLVGMYGLNAAGVDVFDTASKGVDIEGLKEENKKLWQANERYLEASKDMEQKLKHLTEENQ